jgi:hypothetical protein
MDSWPEEGHRRAAQSEVSIRKAVIEILVVCRGGWKQKGAKREKELKNLHTFSVWKLE